jgi:rhodanese-related sulfurtransferase
LGRLVQGAGAVSSAGRVQRALNRFFEYVVHHPFLVSAAAILAVLAIVIEFRHRARGSSAVAPADAVRLANTGALLLDVRDGPEYEAGHIIEARSLPAAELAAKAETLKKYKEKPVIVYCENGMTSGAAARTLRAGGFNKVVTLRGGLGSWRQENLPLVKGAARKDGKQA